MAWMPMPGQTWLGAAASFVAMWLAMMVAMMMPSLVPTLWGYRQAAGKARDMRRNWLTVLFGGGYFFAWTVFGIVVFPLGAALAAIEMQRASLARVVPIAVGVVVVIAGVLQASSWKARHLACWGEPSRRRALPTDAAAAWRHGLRLGLHCIYSCIGFTAILLALGFMDLRVMALVTVAITAERLTPNGERVARAVGFVVVVLGLLSIARAAAALR